MASYEDNNENDIMVRLSNHVNDISLILDIVDVSALPRGSQLEKIIAQQLLELRDRLAPLTAVGSMIPAHPHCGVSAASSIPASPLTLQEKGWLTLEQECESDNFEINGHEFYCIPCERTMHSKNLLSHVRGRAHHNATNYVEEEDYFEEEEEEESGDESNVDRMVEEMDDCNHDRRLELMWHVVWAVDESIGNIESNGKCFYCRLCDKNLNGPLQVVGHVRGSIHRGD